MTVYSVITAKPQPLVESLLNQHYAGQFFTYSPQTWLVASKETAVQVSAKLGAKQRLPDGSVVGEVDGYVFVTELGPSYWGFANTSLWNWLKEAHEGRI